MEKTNTFPKYSKNKSRLRLFGIILAGITITYGLLFAPLHPSNVPKTVINSDALNDRGDIKVLPFNRPKISGYSLDRANGLMQKNHIDLSKYRITAYHKSDTLNDYVVNAEYVMNGLPILGVGIVVQFHFDSNERFDRKIGFEESTFETKYDEQRLKTDTSNEPLISPVQAFEIAIKAVDTTCDFGDLFKNARQRDLQMELLYWAETCVNCSNSHFGNLPYELYLAWVVTVRGSDGGPQVVIDAKTGDIIWVWSGITDCGGP